MVGDTAAGKARKERIDLSGERWLAPLPMFHAYVSVIRGRPVGDKYARPFLLSH